jgi:hypothetical protein
MQNFQAFDAGSTQVHPLQPTTSAAQSNTRAPHTPTAARSLWRQRPLPQDLLTYAAADVRYLLPMANAMVSLIPPFFTALSTLQARLHAGVPIPRTGREPPPAAALDGNDDRARALTPGVAYRLSIGEYGAPSYAPWQQPAAGAAGEAELSAGRPGVGGSLPGPAQEGVEAAAATAAAAAGAEAEAGGLADEGVSSLMLLLPERSVVGVRPLSVAGLCSH